MSTWPIVGIRDTGASAKLTHSKGTISGHLKGLSQTIFVPYYGIVGVQRALARTELWFGHGCSAQRMLLEHEQNYGLGMDALVTVCSYGLGMDAMVTVCSWNANGIMVWAWMLW